MGGGGRGASLASVGRLKRDTNIPDTKCDGAQWEDARYIPRGVNPIGIALKLQVMVIGAGKGMSPNI